MQISIDEINDLIRKETHNDGSPISALESIQARYRYLPPEALILVSENFDVPLSQVYSVATFYHVFSLKPKGKHSLHVCMGTACHVRGSPQILDRLQTKLDVKPGGDHARPIVHTRNPRAVIGYDIDRNGYMPNR